MGRSIRSRPGCSRTRGLHVRAMPHDGKYGHRTRGRRTVSTVTDPKERLADESDGFLQRLRELGELELAKRDEPISSPKFHRLAAEVSAKSREIAGQAARQEQTGNETERGEESIEDVEDDRSDGYLDRPEMPGRR